MRGVFILSSLYDIINYNKEFVASKKYVAFETTKFPNKKMVILSCMDTRLIELLPKALNLKNGDAKIIKNAGAVVAHPFGSIMRSILIAIYELKAEEVYVIGHLGCGMSDVNPESVISKMIDAGISEDTINSLEYTGVDINNWLHGFGCVYESVRESVKSIKEHPLMPNVPVHGLIMDPSTGGLELVVDGNNNLKSGSVITLADLARIKNK